MFIQLRNYNTRIPLILLLRVPQDLIWLSELCPPCQNQIRRHCLNKAKFLKGSQYDQVYIRRDLTYIQGQGMRREQQPASQVFSASSSRLQSATENCSESDAPQAETSSWDGARRDPPASAQQSDSSDSSGPTAQGAPADQSTVGATAPSTQANYTGQSSSTQHTVLRCCTVNLNGICNKMCSLTRLIKEHDFKIICVTEFHLTSSISNSIASIQHFQLFCKDVLGDVEKHVVCVYVPT